METKTASMQIAIQLATLKHLEQIVGIVRQTAKWLKTTGILQWSENFPVSRLEEELLKGELFVVLDSAHKIIGTVTLSRNKGEFWPDDNSTAVYLNRLAILREYSGLNLGIKLVDWAKEFSRQRDISLLRLNCDKTNPFLPKFYQRCGFDCVGEFFFAPWNMTFNLYEMEL